MGAGRGNLGKHEGWRKSASVERQKQKTSGRWRKGRDGGDTTGSTITMVSGNARGAWQIPQIGGKCETGAHREGMMPRRAFIHSSSPQTGTYNEWKTQLKATNRLKQGGRQYDKEDGLSLDLIFNSAEFTILPSLPIFFVFLEISYSISVFPLQKQLFLGSL